MSKPSIVIEKKQVAKLALFSLIAGLPTAAGYALIAGGDSVFFSHLENALNSITGEADAAGETVTHNFPSGWTNNPNWNVIVADCDCPSYILRGVGYTGGAGDDGYGGDSGDDGDSTCFVAGTLVAMEDGSTKSIEEVKIGEKVKGKDGVMNEVVEYERVVIGKRGVFKINDVVEVTGDHPFLAADGKSWKVCDLELFKSVADRGNADLNPAQLAIGDKLLTQAGEVEIISLQHSFERSEDEIVYDFRLNGNHTYIANGFVVHNCGGDSSDGDSDGM